jgi:hypothetical protein
MLTAGNWLRDAMQFYQRAEAEKPAGNDDARLRWNACARTLNAHPGLLESADEPALPVMLE